MQFHHTYLTFRQLMVQRDPKERLSQALNTVYQPIADPSAKNFFEMGSSIATGIFHRHATEFNSKLNTEIKNIFNSEQRKTLQQDKDNNTQLIEIISNNYSYIFITNNMQRVTILTNFYKLENTSDTATILHYNENEPFYSTYLNYLIINTYEPFLQYAESINQTPDRNLNPNFFNIAKDQIAKPYYPYHFNYITLNDITFNNTSLNSLIILYNYNPNPPF